VRDPIPFLIVKRRKFIAKNARGTREKNSVVKAKGFAVVIPAC
jgi:hypothetical protein